MKTREAFARQVAAEIQAEVHRQQRSAHELSEVLESNDEATQDRLNGHTEITLDEFARIIDWLRVDVRQLLLLNGSARREIDNERSPHAD